MFRKRTFIHLLVLMFTMVGLFLSACGPTPTPESAPPTPTPAPEEPTPTPAPPTPAPKGGWLNYGWREPDTLDPAATYSSWVQIEQSCLYDTLVHWGPDKEYYPGLAESWELSEDGKTYTFNLRKDVKFHDGTPFNAEAVKFTFDRIGVAKTTIGKGAAGLMGTYESTEVVDDYTVKVHFEKPFAAFLSSVSDPFLSIVSPTAVEKWGDEEYGWHPVGTGPFVFKEYVAADHLTLEKNPDYNWAPSFFNHQGPAYLDGVTFYFMEEDTTRVACLEKGECNFVSRVPMLEVDRLKADERFEVVSAETPMMPQSLMINVQKYPLDDVRVRQAILYAVDQETMVQTLFKGLDPAAYGPLSPANPGYWEGVEEMYPFDPEKAQELLSEAGWEPGPDGIRVNKDGERLSLYQIVPPIVDVRGKVWEFVQAQLREVGIEVTIEELESAANFEKSVAGEHHMCQLQWGFTDPSGMRIMWHSENEGTGFNWSHVREERVDELLEKGEGAVDWAEREAIYQELQKIIMEEAWILPLHVYTASHASSVEVHDIMVRPTARHVWLYDTYIEQ